jgi:hypothetical protein
VSGFERLLSLGEDTGRLEMGWEASSSFGGIVAALTPAVELGVLGVNSENKICTRALKTDFLKSRSLGDLTTYSLNSSTNEKSLMTRNNLSSSFHGPDLPSELESETHVYYLFDLDR